MGSQGGDVGALQPSVTHFASRPPMLDFVGVGEPWEQANGALLLANGEFECPTEAVLATETVGVRQYRGLAHPRSPGELVWELPNPLVTIAEGRLLVAGSNMGVTIHHHQWKAIDPINFHARGTASVATQISKMQAERKAAKTDEVVRPVVHVGFDYITAVDLVPDRGVQLRMLFEPPSDGIAVAAPFRAGREMAKYLAGLIARSRANRSDKSNQVELQALASDPGEPVDFGPVKSWSIPNALSLPPPVYGAR